MRCSQQVGDHTNVLFLEAERDLARVRVVLGEDDEFSSPGPV